MKRLSKSGDIAIAMKLLGEFSRDLSGILDVARISQHGTLRFGAAVRPVLKRAADVKVKRPLTILGLSHSQVNWA